jgi:hypothetical protein
MPLATRVLTVEEMERMTPSERAAAIDAGTMHSLDELPPAFREAVIKRATEIHQRLHGTPTA